MNNPRDPVGKRILRGKHDITAPTADSFFRRSMTSRPSRALTPVNRRRKMCKGRNLRREPAVLLVLPPAGSMPRGGSHEPDDFSPYKTADGRDLKLLKSGKSTTGYFCIVKLRNKFYELVYIKKKLDAESCFRRIPRRAIRAPRDEGQVAREKHLDFLYGEAWELLQVPSPDRRSHALPVRHAFSTAQSTL